MTNTIRTAELQTILKLYWTTYKYIQIIAMSRIINYFKKLLLCDINIYYKQLIL